MKEYKRLKDNLNVLLMHNTTNKSVLQLTDYRKTENELIKEIVYDAQKLTDKIENGTLIELPCKVGDTVYCIYRDDDYEYWIEAEEVVDFIINDCDIDIGTACRMIGKVYREEVFPTKAEAEAKLKELKGV